VHHVPDRTSHTEVDKNYRTVGTKHEVGRLDIAMDHGRLMAVEMIKGCGRLSHVVNGFRY
jgi:hypothetical protein